MKNYCGFKWFPEKLNEILSRKFNMQCKLHDDMYKKQAGRAMADYAFLVQMLIVSETKIHKFTAYVFYMSVRLFGWISYNKVKKETKER